MKLKSFVDVSAPTDVKPRTQRMVATITGLTGGILVIAMRVFAERHPGPNGYALFVLLLGMFMVGFGGIWYIAARKAEDAV